VCVCIPHTIRAQSQVRYHGQLIARHLPLCMRGVASVWVAVFGGERAPILSAFATRGEFNLQRRKREEKQK